MVWLWYHSRALAEASHFHIKVCKLHGLSPLSFSVVTEQTQHTLKSVLRTLQGWGLAEIISLCLQLTALVTTGRLIHCVQIRGRVYPPYLSLKRESEKWKLSSNSTPTKSAPYPLINLDKNTLWALEEKNFSDFTLKLFILNLKILSQFIAAQVFHTDRQKKSTVT